MLFFITTWIIALTVIGILAVCVFRYCCEPETDSGKKYDEKVKLAPETNHYEPLNHELKKIEAGAAETKAAEAAAAEKKDSEKPVAEAILVDVKTTEPVVSEEKKPLNTESVDNQDVLQEVRVTNAAAKPPSNAVVVSTVVIETQHTQQTSVSSAGNAPNTPKPAEIPSPPSPAVKVTNVTVSAAAPISEPVVEQKAAVVQSQQDSPTDVVVLEQQNNNEVPTPYSEVEGTTLPRVNGPAEAAVKTSVLPA